MKFEHYEALPVDHGQWGSYVSYALMMAPVHAVRDSVERTNGEDVIIPSAYHDMCESVSELAARDYGVGLNDNFAQDTFLQGMEIAYAMMESSGVYGEIRLEDAPLTSSLDLYARYLNLMLAGYGLQESESTVDDAVASCVAEVQPGEEYEELLRFGMLAGFAMAEHGERHKHAEAEAELTLAEVKEIIEGAFRRINRDDDVA